MEIILDHNINHYIRPGTSDEFVVREINPSYKDLNIQSHDIVMDAGGNIGAFARWAAQQAHTVISYEPCKENFHIYNLNVQDCRNVIAHNKALVHTHEKEVSFWLNVGKNKGMHSDVKRRGRQEIKVEATNFLDEVNFYAPTVLKMDIEGGEYNLLKDPLPECIRTLAIEIHLNKRSWRQEQAHNLIQLLASQFTHIIKEPKITEGNWATVGIYKR